MKVEIDAVAHFLSLRAKEYVMGMEGEDYDNKQLEIDLRMYFYEPREWVEYDMPSGRVLERKSEVRILLDGHKKWLANPPKTVQKGSPIYQLNVERAEMYKKLLEE